MYVRRTPSPRMVRQELDMSCGAACARQLLLDVGVHMPESVLRERASFDPVNGISAKSLGALLSALHEGVSYDAGAVFPEHLGTLICRAPFLALLGTPRGRHWIIVDGLSDGLVEARDPCGIPEVEATTCG